MDAIEALLILDEKLVSNTPRTLTADEVRTFGELIVIGAAYREGYEAFVWQAGVKLLQQAVGNGMTINDLFNLFGWRAITSGLTAAIEERNLLACLSFVETGFLPEGGAASVFNHPLIIDTIGRQTDVLDSLRFYPNELLALSTERLVAFVELIALLEGIGFQQHVLLQWIASLLRILSREAPIFTRTVTLFVQGLIIIGRLSTAYYAFRALAEQSVEVWRHQIFDLVLCKTIRAWIDEREQGPQAIKALIEDPAVQQRGIEKLDNLLILACASVRLVRLDGWGEAENAAWLYINEVHSISSPFAQALGMYLSEEKQPEPPNNNKELRLQLQQAFEQAVAEVKRQMRPRSYARLHLAAKIYQSNTQRVYQPCLSFIVNGQPEEALMILDSTDDESIVTEHKLQQQATSPIDGGILRSMARDSKEICTALHVAAEAQKKLIDLDKQFDANKSRDTLVYKEFQELLQLLEPESAELLRHILPNFIEHLLQGVENTTAERDND